MDLYEVFFTDAARRQLRSYVSYIRYTLLNEVAAESLVQDARESQIRLEAVAGSLPLCDHPKLQEKKFRAFSFKKHKYVMIYKLEEKTAVVYAVYHQSQDYQETFAEIID